MFLLAYASFSFHCHGELYFDDSMLHTNNGKRPPVDLTLFIKSDYQPEGLYDVDLYINDTLYGKNKFNFTRGKNGELHAIFDEPTLILLGVKEKYISAEKKEKTYIEHYISGAYDVLNLSKQRVDITVPQAALNKKVKDPFYKQRWNDGVNSSFVNYTLNQSITHSGGQSDSLYLNLANGINLSDWRLRNTLTYRDSDQTTGQWHSQNLYAMKSIKKIDSIFRVGDDATSNEIFDSVFFRGASLYSDTSMLPDNQQGYAPVVRGIARSNALVTIRQAGYVIYEANVPPGPFEISDLNNAITGKELDVTVVESTGEIRNFQQGFTTLPMMLREGTLQYNVNAGEHSNNDNNVRKSFSQGTLSYGLPYETTLYGGAIYSENYTGLAVGVGKNLGILGAASVDTQKSSNRVNGQATQSGQSQRIRYSKMFDSTSTAINISANVYDNSFYSLSDAFLSSVTNKRRSRIQFSASQPLGYWGGIYISGSQGTFYGQEGSNWDVNGGYSGSYKQISYSVNVSYNKNSVTPSDKQLFVELRVPLSYFTNNIWSSYKLLRDNSGRETYLVGINGVALDNKNLSYSVQKGMRNYGSGGSERVSASYLSSFSKLSGEYNQTGDNKQINYNIQGGIVAHPYGVTLSRPLGETTVLVRAPGASGVKLQYRDGLSTDYRGYAIVPYANHYRDNYISLDPRSLKEDTELGTTAKTVTPTRGALVLADFPTHFGAKVLMKVKYKGGYPVFGATGSIGETSSGIVATDGELYLTGVPSEGNVKVTWGDKDTESCNISYILPKERETGVSVYLMDVICV